MSKEYVEREAVERFIENGLNNPDKAKAFGHDAIEIMAEIHCMPAADVAPVKHGRWIKQEGQWRMNESGESVNIHLCSCCGGYFRNAPYKYCPNCGARMDGDTDV